MSHHFRHYRVVERHKEEPEPSCTLEDYIPYASIVVGVGIIGFLIGFCVSHNK